MTEPTRTIADRGGRLHSRRRPARLAMSLALMALAFLPAPGAAAHAQDVVIPAPAPGPPSQFGWAEIDAELEVSEQAQLRALRASMTEAQQAAMLKWASYHDLGGRGQMIGRMLAAPLDQQQAFVRFLPILSDKELGDLAWRSNEIRRQTFEFVLRYVARTAPDKARAMLFEDDYLEPFQTPEFHSLPPDEQKRLMDESGEFLEYWEIVAQATNAVLAPPFTSRWQAQLFKSGASASAYTPLEVRRERENFGVTLQDYERWHECGGVLIAPRWVLTAAHCIKAPRMGPFIENRRVRTGTRSLLEGGTTWRIGAVVRHGRYDPRLKINDIALLQLAPDRLTRVEANRAARSARLPRPGDAPLRIGEELSLTGWGVTGETAMGSKFRDLGGLPKRPTAELMLAKVKLVPASVCNANPLFRETSSSVGRGQLCALGDDEQDACQGDSGGPLVRQAAGQQTLVGLVSYGMGCGLPDTPGVYLDLRSYLGWIKDAMRQAKPNEVVDWPGPTAAPRQ